MCTSLVTPKGVTCPNNGEQTIRQRSRFRSAIAGKRSATNRGETAYGSPHRKSHLALLIIYSTLGIIDLSIIKGRDYEAGRPGSRHA